MEGPPSWLFHQGGAAKYLVKEDDMGLLDQIVKGLAGKFLGGGAGTQNPLLDIALGLINNPQAGGLTGLLETFKGKGLGDAVSSWISTGQNQPVSGEQIQHVLGKEQIQQIAEKIGIPKGEVSSGLASILPEIIDKLTPNGTLPESGMLEQGLSLLKKQLLSK
jgi:uncharacterized protein YidB (DUF937 family)